MACVDELATLLYSDLSLSKREQFLPVAGRAVCGVVLR